MLAIKDAAVHAAPRPHARPDAEAGARLCPAARLLVVISLGTGLTERSADIRRHWRARTLPRCRMLGHRHEVRGHSQCRGTRDRSGTLPCTRRGGQRGPTALSLIDTHATGFRVARRRARLRAATAFFFRRTLGFS